MKRFVAIAAAGIAIAVLSAGQSTTINGGRIIRGVWDASSAAATKPLRTGTVLPASCEIGEAFFKTDAEPGENLYLCTAAGMWSEVSGGIVSGAGQLADFAVTRTSDTVLTVANTGAVRFGNRTCPVPGAPANLTIASGSGITGTARLYVTPGCTLIWGLNVTDSTKITCDQNCSIVDGVAAFPSDSVPLFEWNASAGQWSAAGTDLRAFLSAKASRAAAQGGIVIATQSDGADEISVDASVVSTFHSGTASPPATCQVGQKYNKTDTNQSYECTSVNAWTEVTAGGTSYSAGTGISIAGGVITNAGIVKPTTKRWALMVPIGTGTTLSYFGDSPGTQGTTSAASPDPTNGVLLKYTSADTQDAYAGYYGNPILRYGRNLYGEWRVLLGTVTLARVFVGFSNSNMATTLGSDDPPIHGAGFRFHQGTDTNWQCLSNDGSGGGTITDSSIAPSGLQTFSVTETVGSPTTWVFRINETAVCTHTGGVADIPGGANPMQYVVIKKLDANGTGTRDLSLYSSYIQGDN